MMDSTANLHLPRARNDVYLSDRHGFDVEVKVKRSATESVVRTGPFFDLARQLFDDNLEKV